MTVLDMAAFNTIARKTGLIHPDGGEMGAMITTRLEGDEYNGKPAYSNKLFQAGIYGWTGGLDISNARYYQENEDGTIGRNSNESYPNHIQGNGFQTDDTSLQSPNAPSTELSNEDYVTINPSKGSNQGGGQGYHINHNPRNKVDRPKPKAQSLSDRVFGGNKFNEGNFSSFRDAEAAYDDARANLREAYDAGDISADEAKDALNRQIGRAHV